MEENYLARWLNGELSESEEKAFKKSPEFRTYQRIIDTASKLDAPAFDTEKALKRALEARNGSGGKVVSLVGRMRWLRVAAAAILFLAAGVWFWNSRQPTVSAGIAQHKEVVLPDASEVVLNAGSSLRYAEDSWAQDRRIQLEGEAFFKVAKGKTFTVETSVGKVRVLGTQFNVLQRDGIFVVSCFEGRVRVESLGESVELPPGKQYRLVRGEAELRNHSESGAPGWTRDESRFVSMPLSFVLEELERQHDVEVRTTGIDPNLTFSGSFSNTNLELALKSISTPVKISYEVNGNKVLFYAGNTP